MSEDDTTIPEGGTTMREGGTTIPPGIGDDVRLIIDTEAGRVLDSPLITLAMKSRFRAQLDGTSELVPFMYRDPIDPDEPDAPRPLRHAVLAIVDDKIVSEGLIT